MTKKHAFLPGVHVTRRGAEGVRTTSTCVTCGKPGVLRTTQRGGRAVTYWRHTARPEVEPTSLEACAWGNDGLWCCKADGHAGGHHAHRGPRRNVADA